MLVVLGEDPAVVPWQGQVSEWSDCVGSSCIVMMYVSEWSDCVGSSWRRPSCCTLARQGGIEYSNGVIVLVVLGEDPAAVPWQGQGARHLHHW